MVASIKFLIFLAVAVACVLAMPAEESARAKKQVFYGAYGYGAYPYASAYAAAPLAYSTYSAYPYSAGYSGFRSIYY